MILQGSFVRWWLTAAVAAAVAVAAAGTDLAAAADPAAAAEAAGPCPQLSGCHCQQHGALHCQLSTAAELRSVASQLSSRRDISLADLVVRDLPSLPGGLFSGSALHALLLSGSGARVLPADLLHGLEGSLRALGLGENRLESVPTATLSDLTRLERLDLSGNRLRRVEADSLPKFDRLAELNLADNQLAKLAGGSFAGLQALRTLWLEGNRLDGAQLATGSLRPLSNLERLSLSRNTFSGPLTSQLTSFLPPDILTLSFTDNNFTSISSGALSPLSSLTSLDLSGNRIDLIAARALTGLSQLRSLRLDGNRIVTLPASVFSGLKTLKVLDLSENVLQALTEDVLTPLPSLRRLLLRGNDLIQLDGGLLRALPSLKYLDIGENSLHCDCRLQDLASYLADASSWLDEGDVRQVVCATPPALENAPLVDLTSTQLTCGKPQDSVQESVSSPYPGDVIRLESAQLTATGDRVRLRWHVEPSLSPYRCEEVALASQPNSSRACSEVATVDPTDLQVALPAAGLVAGERYRFCATLVELTSGVELPPACGWIQLTPAPPALPRIVGYSAEVVSFGSIRAATILSSSGDSPPDDCVIAVVLLGPRGPLSAVEASCRTREVTLSAALTRGTIQTCFTDPYRAPALSKPSRPLDPAAAVAPSSPPLRRCFELHLSEGALWWRLVAPAAAAVILIGLVVGCFLARRRRVSSRRDGRTRLESSDSSASDDGEGGESDADEETDLPV